MIKVRRAEIEDIPMIMQFLDDHWLQGYALAHNRELFEWQFVKNGKVNICIGVDDINHIMYGMEGAIPYSSDDNPEISSCLWICEKTDNPALALEITESICNIMSYSGSYGLGLLEDAVRVHRRMKHDIIYMDHYYRLAKKNTFEIAKVTNLIIPDVKEYGYKLEMIKSVDEITEILTPEVLRKHTPQKDYAYLKWRYMDHPVFQYDIWKISRQDGKAESIIVTREENYNKSKSCKIVDFYGKDEDIIYVANELDRLMLERGYEYIDVYSVGFPRDIYEKAGFVECGENSENIIPNHFQPYSCTNCRIALVNIHNDRLRMFRGDSDQDKPRLDNKYKEGKK